MPAESLTQGCSIDQRITLPKIIVQFIIRFSLSVQYNFNKSKICLLGEVPRQHFHCFLQLSLSVLFPDTEKKLTQIFIFALLCGASKKFENKDLSKFLFYYSFLKCTVWEGLFLDLIIMEMLKKSSASLQKRCTKIKHLFTLTH